MDFVGHRNRQHFRNLSRNGNLSISRHLHAYHARQLSQCTSCIDWSRYLHGLRHSFRGLSSLSGRTDLQLSLHRLHRSSTHYTHNAHASNNTNYANNTYYAYHTNDTDNTNGLRHSFRSL